MKNYILLVLFMIASIGIEGQSKYQNGYYITNSGEQISCFIEDANWTRNPESFNFKTNPDEAPSQLGINDVVEFGILDRTKFIRQTVSLEISSNRLERLSKSSDLVREEKQVFLKVIVEGNTNLYEYTGPDVKNFFYQIENGPIELLEYKRYLDNSEIKANENYKNQLFTNLKCDDLDIKAIRKVDYETRDLSKFFKKYNTCQGERANTYFNRQKEELRIGIQPSISSAFLNLNFAADESRPLRDRLDTDFDTELQFRFGVEFEYLFSFQKQKWSIFAAPTFQRYTSTTQTLDTDNSTLIDVEADYTSFEISSGVRHYMFLNDVSAISLEGGVTWDFPISNSVLAFSTRNEDLSMRPNANLLFGVGYRYDKKYSLLLRYQLNRDLLKDNEAYDARFSSLSLIFTYYLNLNID